MKKKVGTVIDEELLRQAKLVAARDDVQLAQVFEDALRLYLRRAQSSSHVELSRGALQAPPEVVHTILEDEQGFLDA